MELGELHRTIHGRTAEREVASGEMYRKTKKHGSDAMSQNVRSGSPRAGPSQSRFRGVQVCVAGVEQRDGSGGAPRGTWGEVGEGAG